MRRGETSPVGVCPVCARVTKLLTDGTIRVHGWIARNGATCAGAYSQPVHAPTDLPQRTETATGNWTEQAACAGCDPELWFTKDARPAKRVCASCPVRFDCLQWALDRHVEYGTWGGLDEYERKALVRA